MAQKITALIATLLVLAGLFMLSEVSLGVGLIATAGTLGVWTRVAQADRHHKEHTSSNAPSSAEE